MPKDSIAENKLKYYNFFHIRPIFVWIHVAIRQILTDSGYFRRTFGMLLLPPSTPINPGSDNEKGLTICRPSCKIKYCVISVSDSGPKNTNRAW